MAKELRMNQAQMNEFHKKCLNEHLLGKQIEVVISYLSQFVKEVPEVEPAKSDKKELGKS